MSSAAAIGVWKVNFMTASKAGSPGETSEDTQVLIWRGFCASKFKRSMVEEERTPHILSTREPNLSEWT